jgi:hypothetical protein
MNHSTWLAAVVLVAANWPALAAPLAACPQQQREGKRMAVLESAAAFDGAPENKTDVPPNLANLEWDLANAQKQAQERGDSVYLVCRYKGIKSTVTLQLPPAATVCKMEGIKDRTHVWCGERLQDSDITSR